MTLAHLHAAALASVATTGVLLAFETDLRRFPSAVNPVLSVLAGTFVGFLLFNLGRAARRVPRRTVEGADTARVVISGCLVGFLGVVAVAAAIFSR